MNCKVLQGSNESTTSPPSVFKLQSTHKSSNVIANTSNELQNATNRITIKLLTKWKQKAFPNFISIKNWKIEKQNLLKWRSHKEIFHKKRWNSHLDDDDDADLFCRTQKKRGNVSPRSVNLKRGKNRASSSTSPRTARIRYRAQGLISRIIWNRTILRKATRKKKLDNDYSNNPEIEIERGKKCYTHFAHKSARVAKKKIFFSAARTFGFIWLVDVDGEEADNETSERLIKEN